MKAVFDVRPGSGYDDDIVCRYHFPCRYLNVAEQCVDDWIVYREGRRDGGRKGYVAAARVACIFPDRDDPKRAYARVTDFLPFDNVVPFKRDGRYWETPLNAVGTPTLIGSTLQGRSVREISDADFGAIVRAGLAATLAPENGRRLDLDGNASDPLADELLRAPEAEQERRIAQILCNRPIRDAAFRRRVLAAYDKTCAITGLRIVNGGGRAEAQAAHVRPVAEGGPDIVQNGIALSATCHWLFDRHLISLNSKYHLQVAPSLLKGHNHVPAEMRQLLHARDAPIRMPQDRSLRPRPDFVAWHYERFDGA